MSLVLVYALFVVIRLGQILPRALILVCIVSCYIASLFYFLATEYAIRTTPYDSFGNGGPCPSCGEPSSTCLASDPVRGLYFLILFTEFSF